MTSNHSRRPDEAKPQIKGVSGGDSLTDRIEDTLATIFAAAIIIMILVIVLMVIGLYGFILIKAILT